MPLRVEGAPPLWAMFHSYWLPPGVTPLIQGGSRACIIGNIETGAYGARDDRFSGGMGASVNISDRKAYLLYASLGKGMGDGRAGSRGGCPVKIPGIGKAGGMVGDIESGCIGTVGLVSKIGEGQRGYRDDQHRGTETGLGAIGKHYGVLPVALVVMAGSGAGAEMAISKIPLGISKDRCTV